MAWVQDGVSVKHDYIKMRQVENKRHYAMNGLVCGVGGRGKDALLCQTKGVIVQAKSLVFVVASLLMVALTALVKRSKQA